MNAEAPAWLGAQVRSHNRHALGLAAGSLAGALLAWGMAYFFFVLILLGFDTSIHGDRGPQMPAWIPAAAGILAGILLAWGVVDQYLRRFVTASDRPIIGVHLFADFLLLPVRLLFAVWGNLYAVRRLKQADIDRAWELLRTIERDGQGRLSSLTLVEPDAGRLYWLLSTLQMLDLIDLHRGKGDWFYTLRSSHAEEIGKLLTGGAKKY